MVLWGKWRGPETVDSGMKKQHFSLREQANTISTKNQHFSLREQANTRLPLLGFF